MGVSVHRGGGVGVSVHRGRGVGVSVHRGRDGRNCQFRRCTEAQ